MDTPTRRMTRSAAKKDSPDSGKKPPFHSKQKVIYLDTPTPTKGSILEKNKNPHDEAGQRRLGSCSSKGMHKIEKSDKPILDKVAQSVSSSKIKNPQTGISSGLGDQQNFSDLFDDKFYTEDVMEQVEEIIKSAEKSKNSNTIEIESEGAYFLIDETATEIPVKRQRKPGILTKSPYIDGRQPVRESTSSFLFEACAFNIGLKQPFIEEVRSFEDWFYDSYRPDNIKRKFLLRKIKINPPFVFGPFEVSYKTWWYELRDSAESLRDTHVDICFYYLRKMATFNKKIRMKVTTTDSFFGSMVRGIYPAVVENSNALARQVSLLEYLLGEYLHCNTPWTEVDHVLMPIRMGVRAHWILGHMDIRNRCINVYNSCSDTIRDREVIADVQPFAFVIPHLMANIDVWQPMDVDDIQRIEPLVVNLVHDIPQQSNGTDCGFFVIKYAEFFINDNMQSMPNSFDATSERTYMASQLYKHGLHKINEGYESDPDFVSRREIKARKADKKK
ncbi:uncharacterized protein Fot_30311 [Forsythia ovata]|uniref:Ubiquitin-like protease family profile domain-containing protein n=1 Tax=Forsythia ovata TaxID=205694 RepID=A0ABD1TUD1_9LAMI